MIDREDNVQTSQLAQLRGFLQQDPENWNLRADLFDAALAAGELEEARTQLDRARAQLPDDAAWKHRQGVLMLATRDYAAAQLAFEELLAAGQQESAILFNLAYAIFMQGRFQEASERLVPLLSRSDPGALPAWTLWIRCKHRLDDFDETLAAFRARAAEARMPADAWGAASLMAFDLGALQDAQAWSARALQERPDQLEALVTRGSLALAVQDVPAALGVLERALQVNPRDGRTWSAIAMTRMLSTDLPKADEAFARAVETMPGHIGTWIAWGWCRFLQKRLDLAQQAIEEALRLDRNFGESHGAYSVLLATRGQKVDAEREVEIALRLDPTCMSARYAQAILSGDAQDPEKVIKLGQRLLSRQRTTLIEKMGKA
jgi:tetratricopeptide (TPR) repeat protein